MRPVCAEGSILELFYKIARLRAMVVFRLLVHDDVIHGEHVWESGLFGGKPGVVRGLTTGEHLSSPSWLC